MQRQSGVAQEQERDYQRESREEAQQAKAQRSRPVAPGELGTEQWLGQLLQSFPQYFQLVQRHDRRQLGRQCISDDALRSFGIRRLSYCAEGQSLISPVIDTSQKIKATVDNAP